MWTVSLGIDCSHENATEKRTDIFDKTFIGIMDCVLKGLESIVQPWAPTTPNKTVNRE